MSHADAEVVETLVSEYLGEQTAVTVAESVKVDGRRHDDVIVTIRQLAGYCAIVVFALSVDTRGVRAVKTPHVGQTAVGIELPGCRAYD